MGIVSRRSWLQLQIIFCTAILASHIAWSAQRRERLLLHIGSLTIAIVPDLGDLFGSLRSTAVNIGITLRP